MEKVFIISILAGELVKFPFFGIQGPVLLDLTIFLFCLIGLFQIKFKFRKPNLLIKLGALFIGISILSLILTPLLLSTNEFLISFSYTLRFSLYFLIYYLLYCGAFPDFKKNIYKSLLFSGIGLSCLGLLQFLILPNLAFLQTSGWDPHYFRTVSTFLDPNFAGAYFVLTLLLIMSLRGALATRQSNLFFILVYVSLLTTFSRSSYLMFFVSGISFSLLKKSKKIFAATIILFVVLMLGFQLYTQLIAKPKGIDRKQSASYRIDTWQDGLSIFQKSPFLGVGFNTYKYALREYKLADEQFLESRGSSTNDSSLLYVLATTGIIGFSIYILFLISILKISIKNNYLVVAALSGLIIHSFFANSLFFPFILIWILLKASDIKN